MLIIVITVDLVLRLVVGAIGLAVVGTGLFARGEFRWGKRGQGPRIEPQWIGRVFFGLIGAVMLYVALTGFK